MNVIGWLQRESRSWHWFQRVFQASCRGCGSHRDSCWAAHGPWILGVRARQVTGQVSVYEVLSPCCGGELDSGPAAFLQHLTSNLTNTFNLHRFNCTHHWITTFLWSRVKILIITLFTYILSYMFPIIFCAFVCIIYLHTCSCKELHSPNIVCCPFAGGGS